MTIKIEVTPAEANLILQACENSSDQWAFRLLAGKIVRATLKDPADDGPEVEILRNNFHNTAEIKWMCNYCEFSGTSVEVDNHLLRKHGLGPDEMHRASSGKFRWSQQGLRRDDPSK